MSATKDVMIVLPTLRDKAALGVMKEEYRFHWMEDENFLYPRPKPEFDMIQYTERCSEYVEKNNIQAVVYSHDLANYVAGVLCDRYNLPGPTLESMFLCNHKYYSRRAEVKPIWSDYIDLDTGAWGNKEPRFPCYIKPAILTMTLLQYTINTPEELEKALAVLRRELPEWTKPFRDFYAKYLDLKKYPLATKNIAVVDELVEDATQYVIEGWVTPEGEICVLPLSDSNYYPGKELAIDNYSTPSTLPEHIKKKMIDFSIENVKSHGVKGSFWNVEMWLKGEECLVTEVNGRAASVWHKLYLGTFRGSLYKAMLYLSCGELDRCLAEAPHVDPATPDRVGGQFHVITYGEGKASDFLDYEFIRSLKEPEVQIFVPEDYEIQQTRTSGFWLARFHIFGTDYNEICKKADALRAKMLKRPELSPQSGK